MIANNTPTAFTDEQLEDLVTKHRKQVHYKAEFHPCGLCKLINRLQAAEAINKRSALWHDGECEIMNGVMRCEEDCDCGSYETHKNWLIATGKY